MRIKIADLSSSYYRCEICSQCLPSHDFYKSYLQRKRLRCKACVTYQRTLCNRHSLYGRLLDTLRRSEKKLNQCSFTPDGRLTIELVRQCFSLIWRGQSALPREEGEDNTSLVLVRWDIHQPFSPHNNIVFTVKQAAKHYNEQFQKEHARELLYGVPFCRAVDQLLLLQHTPS